MAPDPIASDVPWQESTEEEVLLELELDVFPGVWIGVDSDVVAFPEEIANAAQEDPEASQSYDRELNRQRCKNLPRN
jgi:hypothetical protein